MKGFSAYGNKTENLQKMVKGNIYCNYASHLKINKTELEKPFLSNKEHGIL